MKRLIAIAIYTLILIINSNKAEAYNYRLICYDSPAVLKDHLSIVYNIKESSNKVAAFEVIASNPELDIRGCTLDIYLNDERYLALDHASVKGFGQTISVMDHDNGRCRMVTVVKVSDPSQKAEGVLLKFKVKLIQGKVWRFIPRVDLQRSGLIDANGKFIDGSSLCIGMGYLEIR